MPTHHRLNTSAAQHAHLLDAEDLDDKKFRKEKDNVILTKLEDALAERSKLHEKYKKLQKDYDALKSSNPDQDEFNKLRQRVHKHKNAYKAEVQKTTE